jgi:hypothetical protein
VQPPTPSQVELTSQAPGVQVKAVPPQVPAVQTSVFVQALPSSQVVLSALLVHAVVEVAGSQLWQGFEGLAAPEA